jgi:hypothetical protein
MMAFAETEPLRAKIIVDGKLTEQVNTFKYLGCETSVRNNRK